MQMEETSRQRAEGGRGPGAQLLDGCSREEVASLLPHPLLQDPLPMVGWCGFLQMLFSSTLASEERKPGLLSVS